MIRHHLVNPIRRDGKEIEFAKYVKMHKEQQYSTDTRQIEALREEFYDAHLDVSEENLTKAWDFVSPRLTNNVGLLEFIKDNDGHKSDFFFPWLVNVFKSPATALEISYGSGPDLNGEWHKDIMSTEDPFVPFIKDDPAFVYNRERQLFVADLVASTDDLVSTYGRKAKVVDFGAGLLAWYRWHNDPEYTLFKSTIYAFDRDPSIKPDRLFTKDPEELGIFYKHGDFTRQLGNPNCRNSDLVILGGVASYIPPADFSDKIVSTIYQLLNLGGVFFFDLQLDCPCYQHSMDILGWPKFDIPATASEVIDRIETMRKALWENRIKFTAEYHIDSYNRIPSAVMVVFQKVS